MKKLRPITGPSRCSEPTWNYLESGITVRLASPLIALVSVSGQESEHKALKSPEQKYKGLDIM